MAAGNPVTEQLSTYASNLNHQVFSAFERMTIQDYIRLVIIVGAYALLRPYLLKLGGKYQQQDHEREIDPDEMARMKKNVVRDRRNGSLRERIDIPEDTDSDSDGGTGAAAAGMDWGKKARRRQRRVVRTLLEQEEQRKREAEERESDKEIEDLLVD